ncbi:Glycoside hydrolase family 3 domain protein [Modestobacter italicus]|uniref:Glycoside hydrolase family 3 domain protein n=1 Tax=Modestobacter italicus (strain DSM 44449 / CECT 9708 / BC 501) TaxID=2732864 RepID=I4F243_MODI5|nr:glycoside hydrolase family 3 C-terminal domain-containing protein [Modestobacter marinus]CCH89706.1 Glycoside hydrolase family 3 domain protein [Modestobacter marinus]
MAPHRTRRLRAGLTIAATVVVVAGGAAPALATPGRDGGGPAPGQPHVDRQRIAALVAQMTVPEQFGMLGGTTGANGAAGAIVGVPRLGVPGLDMADGPSGVRASEPATALPAPIALGATFDRDAATAYGGVLGQEADALGMEVLLGPMMNLVRTPYAGRNFETLSEDPLLTAQLAAPQVAAVQDHGVIATAKHFAANNQELGRQGIDVQVDEKTLHETEFAGFEAVVRAGIGAVMCSYNQVNGVQACEDAELLTHVLREEWGFDGFVMTDWGAFHGAGALEAGLDVEMPRPTAAFTDLNRDANGDGVVDDRDLTPPVAAALDRAVTGVLTAMAEVGLLDDAGAEPERAVAQNAAVARQVATEGAVLLANEGGALPLGADQLADVALVGPTAATPLIGGGGSARVTPDTGAVDSTVDVLRERGAGVTWAVGEDLEGVVVPGSALSTGAPVDTTYTAPVTQTVTVTAPSAGAYTFHVQTTGPGVRMDVEGVPGTDAEASTQRRFGAAGGSLIPTADGRTNDSYTVDLAAGQQVTLTLSCDSAQAGPVAACAPTAEAPLALRLAWTTPELRAERVAEAARTAADADTAVVFAYNEGTEGEDRPSLGLPGFQDDVIAAVAAANPDTVVVLNTGDPVLMPWLDDVRAVLQMWYPGQEGAEATVDLLTGVANPGGRLPETYPAREDATPVSDPANYPGLDTDADPVPDVQTYTEGTDVGYRWYAATGTEPLFAFGHGLSYTSFDYSGLEVRNRHRGLQVSFTVQNTGDVAGTEVPQVYLGGGSAAGTPSLQLAGFDRVALEPGERQRVTVTVEERQLSVWDADADEWVRATGTRPLTVGASSGDVRLSSSVRVR